MLNILFIIGLIVVIFVLSIKYFKAYAKLKSHSSFDSEAHRVLNAFEYKDPKISCDYCGGAINTKHDKVCPHCGASYANDEEWRSRHNIFNQAFVDSSAEDAFQGEIGRIQAETADISARLRNAIIILFVILAVTIVASIFSLISRDSHNFLTANELNEYSYREYEEADYDLVGDGVIIDDAGLKVTIVGIYEDHSYDDTKFRVAYHIENNSKKDLCMDIKYCAINNTAIDDMFYGWIKKGTDMIYYDDLSYLVRDAELSQIVVYSYNIKDTDYNWCAKKETPLVITTTAPMPEALALPTENILFENDYVLIVPNKLEDYDFNDSGLPTRYKLTVYNKTDNFFTFTCNQGTLNNNSIDISSAYHQPLYDFTKYTFSISCYDDDFKKRDISDPIQVSISFSCNEDPSLDFSTGYMQVN